MTDWPHVPVLTSLPPMNSGISIFSLAIVLRRALSDARSGVPGAYERMGSLNGGGTRRRPLKAESDIRDLKYHALRMARAASAPDLPVRPAPGCVPEPQRHRWRTGVAYDDQPSIGRATNNWSSASSP